MTEPNPDHQPRVLTPPERMLLDSFTDDEWLSVIANCDPHADVAVGIQHVIDLREQRRGEDHHG